MYNYWPLVFDHIVEYTVPSGCPYSLTLHPLVIPTVTTSCALEGSAPDTATVIGVATDSQRAFVNVNGFKL